MRGVERYRQGFVESASAEPGVESVSPTFSRNQDLRPTSERQQYKYHIISRRPIISRPAFERRSPRTDTPGENGHAPPTSLKSQDPQANKDGKLLKIFVRIDTLAATSIRHDENRA